MPSRGRGVACAAVCGATALALHRLRDALPAPPIGAWADATAWYDTAGPATATMTLLRIIALVVCSWMAVASALQVGASMRTAPWMRRLADAISPRWLREVGRGMAGVSLSAGLALPAAGGPLLTADVASLPPTEVVDPEPADDTSGVAIMRPLPDPGRPVDAPAIDTTTAPAPPVPAPQPSTYVVAAGDSCWSIAAQLLHDIHGTAPGDRAIWAAWTELIELNRPRFATGDPDLLFPGQQLVLPDLAR